MTFIGAAFGFALPERSDRRGAPLSWGGGATGWTVHDRVSKASRRSENRRDIEGERGRGVNYRHMYGFSCTPTTTYPSTYSIQPTFSQVRVEIAVLRRIPRIACSDRRSGTYPQTCPQPYPQKTESERVGPDRKPHPYCDHAARFRVRRPHRERTPEPLLVGPSMPGLRRGDRHRGRTSWHLGCEGCDRGLSEASPKGRFERIEVKHEDGGCVHPGCMCIVPSP